MARAMDRVTALKVARAIRKPGMYADGGGLYLQMSNSGASWIYRYMLKGVACEMGLGPLGLYGLKEARLRALDARQLRHEGIDQTRWPSARAVDAATPRLQTQTNT
jgi:hypothetical protein